MHSQSLSRAFDKIDNRIDKHGYDANVITFLDTIACDTSNFTKLRADQLALLSGYLRDKKNYNLAAEGFILAYRKGIRDRHMNSYLINIWSDANIPYEDLERGVISNELMKDLTTTLIDYWIQCQKFCDQLMANRKARTVNADADNEKI